MAFICTAAGDRSSFKLLGSEIIVPVGYDEAHPRKDYALMIGFAPAPGGILEFYFNITETTIPAGASQTYWMALLVHRFTTREDRGSILGTLLTGTEILIKALKPREFFCCTYDINLPQKALRKHILLAAVFDSCGLCHRRVASPAWQAFVVDGTADLTERFPSVPRPSCEQESVMSKPADLKALLQSSQERLNAHVSGRCNDPAVKAALVREQNVEDVVKGDKKDGSRQVA